jgi:PKD repeat protein
VPDDTYLSIAAIATDEFMVARLNTCTTQQWYLGNIQIDEKWGTDATAPLSWVANYRHVWASSPGWAAAWDDAIAAHPGDPDYKPGQDPTVITDEMILSTVQALAPLPAPPEEPPPEEPPPPEELVASFAWTPNPPAMNQPVTFDASMSTGDPVRFDWNFGSQIGAMPDAGPTPTVTYSKNGTYNVRLTVFDADGNSSEQASQSVQVTT